MASMFNDLMNGLDEADAFLAGNTEAYKVNLPADIDVRRIRKSLGMTQARFSAAFGLSIDAVKHWEGGRRTPEAAARAFLIVIAKDPRAVLKALHSTSTAHRRVVRAAGKSKTKLQLKRGPRTAARNRTAAR